jgi:methyl-accepting chemotaxis protein
VVASEVKTLADQTAKATDDIKQQIAAIQNSTNGAVDAMQSIVTTMGEVNRNTQEIAGAVQQQSAATSENSHSVREAARGTEDVVAHMPGVTKAVDETTIGDADAAGEPRSLAPGRAAPPHRGEFPAPGGGRRSAQTRKLSPSRKTLEG